MNIKIYILCTDTLPDPLYSREALSALSEYRKEKCLRYKFEKDRKLSLACGILLNHISLEYHFNVSDIIFSEHGKPMLSPSLSCVFFNLSHSGRYAVCAVSDCQIGCDIEEISASHIEVANRFFHKDEQAYLINAKEEKKAEAFCRIWTRKESYLKFTGDGITQSLSSFSTGGDRKKCVIKDIPCFFFEKIICGHILTVCTDKNKKCEFIFL